MNIYNLKINGVLFENLSYDQFKVLNSFADESKIDQIGCIDIGSNAIKYKQFRIIAGDNHNYSKELETYKEFLSIKHRCL